MVLGWLYFDKFLRFLHTIGVENSALIKRVKFTGIVKLHECPGLCYHRQDGCADDLLKSLRLYIPFILKFCTKLETLTIKIEEDRDFRPPVAL